MQRGGAPDQGRTALVLSASPFGALSEGADPAWPSGSPKEPKRAGQMAGPIGSFPPETRFAPTYWYWSSSRAAAVESPS